MYFIASGEVEVKVEPKPGAAGRRAFFGEMALLTGAARSAKCDDATDDLAALEVADFHTMTAHHPRACARGGGGGCKAHEAGRRRERAPQTVPAPEEKSRDRASG